MIIHYDFRNKIKTRFVVNDTQTRFSVLFNYGDQVPCVNGGTVQFSISERPGEKKVTDSINLHRPSSLSMSTLFTSVEIDQIKNKISLTYKQGVKKFLKERF